MVDFHSQTVLCKQSISINPIWWSDAILFDALMDAMLGTLCFAGCTVVWCSPASVWMLRVSSAGATLWMLYWMQRRVLDTLLNALLFDALLDALSGTWCFAWCFPASVWMLGVTSAGATVVRWRLIWCKQSKAAFRHRRVHQRTRWCTTAPKPLGRGLVVMGRRPIKQL